MPQTQPGGRRWRGLATTVLAVLTLGAAAVPARAAKGIFTPKPRGAGESLDPGADASGKTGDVVETRNGDRLVGRVLGIQADGRLRLSGPQFVGEATVPASALASIELRASRGDAERDEIVMTNGDHVCGQLAAVTPQTVVLESPAAGVLKIARRMIRTVSLGGAGTYLLAGSQFDRGHVKPWQMRGGGWSIVGKELVAGGATHITHRGQGYAVYIPLKQTQAITAEVDVQSHRGPPLYCHLVIYSKSIVGRYGQNSVLAAIRYNRMVLGHGRGSGYNAIHNRREGGHRTKGVVRLAYDPATGKARAWFDGKDTGEHAVSTKLKTGTYVMFQSMHPCKVKSIRVWRGVVPPSDRRDRPSDETDTVEYVNKDRVSARAVALDDGTFVVTTPHGQFRSPIDKVAAILFRTKGMQQPRRRKGDVRVKTRASRLTLAFEGLDGEHLVGRSDSLGRVKLRRDCIRHIEFNIYK